jgi:murein DD-endopeptidase MepM/ murein hydrolase activator NlpD
MTYESDAEWRGGQAYDAYGAAGDDWDDDDDGDWDDEQPDHGLMTGTGYASEHREVGAYDETGDLAAYTQARPLPTIIPGGSVAPHPHIPRGKRHRSFTAQLFIIIVTCCFALTALFSAGFIEAASTAQNANPIDALVHAITQSKAAYFMYIARPGDTFDSVASRFGVQSSGIFKLNGLFLDADMIIGKSYEIPTDPTYGTGFIPPFANGQFVYGYATPDFDVPSPDGFNFSAVAGKTNGPTGVCPSGYTAWQGDPANYQFINPDQTPPGKPASGPNSLFVQRFSWHHSGIDISTGTYGTNVYAAQDGTVIFAGWDNGGGGWTLKIGHCGYVATSYSHLVAILPTMKVGTNVTQGEFIGLQGQSGDASGAHVHYMVWWSNVPVDPVCAYPAGIDGWTVDNEGGAYNGCPPALGHKAWP